MSVIGGLATNVSLSMSVDLVFFPLTLNDALGWFFSTKFDAGEGIQYAIGVAGGIPASLPRPGVTGNIGLALGIGIGVGVLPADIAGGVSSSWVLSSTRSHRSLRVGPRLQRRSRLSTNSAQLGVSGESSGRGTRW